MACYESEIAEITLSKKNYKILLNKLKFTYDNDMEKLFTIASEMHKAIKEMKGKLTNEKKLHSLMSYSTERDNSLFLKSENLINEHYYLIFSELFRKECCITNLCDKRYFKGEGVFKLYKPRKSSFKKLNNKVTSFCFRTIEGAVSLDQETLKVEWHVEYTNGGIQKAKDTAIGNAFFDFLNTAKLMKQEIYFTTEEYNEYDESY